LRDHHKFGRFSYRLTHLNFYSFFSILDGFPILDAPIIPCKVSKDSALLDGGACRDAGSEVAKLLGKFSERFIADDS
jgi:hypothetical protein